MLSKFIKSGSQLSKTKKSSAKTQVAKKNERTYFSRRVARNVSKTPHLRSQESGETQVKGMKGDFDLKIII